MAQKINKQVKQLDAAVRLVLANRKKASVVITNGGMVCSTGLDAASPSGLALPAGVYQGEQLLQIYEMLRYCDGVNVTNDQVETGWQIVLTTEDPNARVCLDWQGCSDVAIEPPATAWQVDNEQLKMFKAAYTMAQTLDKNQLRLLRLQPGIGVISYLSPMTVAQWWDQQWVLEAGVMEAIVDIEIADIKRAVLYRGAKLIAIGTSDGKINFAFDDGAFLRVDKYDGDSYDDQQLQHVFTFDESTYSWPLGAEQPAQNLLELIAKGSKVSETDGTVFYPVAGNSDDAVPMPLQCGPAKFTPKVINHLATWADTIQPSGVNSPRKTRSMGFCGVGYRAVAATAFTDEEATERGIE